MKMMVKLAVLMATLLLLTGVAFADLCGYSHCYELTVTEVDNPEHTHTGYAATEFCPGNIGWITGTPFSDRIVLFFDSMNQEALGYLSEIDGLGPCVGYFKFHGDDKEVIKGIGYCDGERHNIKGLRVDYSNCQT